MLANSSSFFTGLVTKPFAPSFIASSTIFSCPMADTIIIFADGSSSMIFCTACNPDSTGIIISMVIMSGFNSLYLATAEAPSSASPTTLCFLPLSFSMPFLSISRINFESSTTSTLAISILLGCQKILFVLHDFRLHGFLLVIRVLTPFNDGRVNALAYKTAILAVNMFARINRVKIILATPQEYYLGLTHDKHTMRRQGIGEHVHYGILDRRGKVYHNVSAENNIHLRRGAVNQEIMPFERNHALDFVRNLEFFRMVCYGPGRINRLGNHGKIFFEPSRIILFKVLQRFAVVHAVRSFLQGIIVNIGCDNAQGNIGRQYLLEDNRYCVGFFTAGTGRRPNAQTCRPVLSSFGDYLRKKCVAQRLPYRYVPEKLRNIYTESIEQGDIFHDIMFNNLKV